MLLVLRGLCSLGRVGDIRALYHSPLAEQLSKEGDALPDLQMRKLKLSSQGVTERKRSVFFITPQRLQERPLLPQSNWQGVIGMRRENRSRRSSPAQ